MTDGAAAPSTETDPAARAPDDALAFQNAAERCPHCGAPSEANSAFCAACGKAVRTVSEGEKPPSDLLTAGFECKSCGAQVACEPGRSSYACAFCGSTYVVELPAGKAGELEPEFVVPFKVQKEKASERFLGWCREGFFTPSDLKKLAKLEKIQGVYLPFWTFSMRADSVWSASIGEYWYETRVETYTDSKGHTRTRTKTVRHTEWHPLSGRHMGYHYHYLVTASKGLEQQEADAVLPFDLVEMQRYRPEFLSGWLAQPFEVQREAALERCQKAFTDAEGGRITAFLPGDTHSNLSYSTSFSQISDDLILLPFWIGAYTYKGKAFRFVLNAQTGAATGTRPKSALKIALVVIGILALVGAIVFLIVSNA